MKQKIVKLIVSLLVVAGSSLPLIAAAGTSEAVNYLKQQTVNEWITMALTAGGETNIAKDYLKTFSASRATDYAKRILAIVAVGENPRTFANIDLVAGLKALAASGQIGDANLLNDDAWGIMALRAAGESASDTVVAGAKNYLLMNQRPDGGWGWRAGGGSDTNDTAAVLMALADVGFTDSDSAVQVGFNYLRVSQQTDGGFPYDAAWPISDSASTSWVISALNKFNQSAAAWTQGSATPISFLQSLQTSDSSFKWQAGDTTGSAAMTAYAVVALTNSFYPVQPANLPGGSGRRNNMVNIKLTVNLSASEFQSGDLIDWEIRLQNLGPDNAQEIDVVNVLPAPFQGATAVLSRGVWQAEKNQWLVGSLAKGASAGLKFTLAAPEVFAKTVWSSLARAITPSDDEFDQTDNQISYAFTVVPKIVAPAAAAAASLNNQPAPKVLGVSDEHCPPLVQPTSFKQNLEAWRGRFLKVAASSLFYYVAAEGEQIYCLESDQAAHQLLSLIGLGITDADLNKIPEPGENIKDNNFSVPLAQVLAGRILLNVDSRGAAWYVAKDIKQRVYLGVFGYAREIMRNLAVTVDNKSLADLAAIPVLPRVLSPDSHHD